jgi:hypothetical protein
LFILFALSPLAKPKIAPAFLILSFTAQMFLLAKFGQWGVGSADEGKNQGYRPI